MLWYRVTFDASGVVNGCEQVEPDCGESTNVVYVQARSPEEATIAAVRLHERMRTRARRARYKKEGRCHCGSKLEPEDGKVCLRCLQLRKSAIERRVAKRQGEEVVEKSRRETQEEGRQERLRNVEIAVLKEVIDAWEKSQSVSAFSSWLKRRLDKAGVTDRTKLLKVVGGE